MPTAPKNVLSCLKVIDLIDRVKDILAQLEQMTLKLLREIILKW